MAAENETYEQKQERMRKMREKDNIGVFRSYRMDGNKGGARSNSNRTENPQQPTANKLPPAANESATVRCLKHRFYTGQNAPDLNCKTCCGIFVAVVRKQAAATNQ